MAEIPYATSSVLESLPTDFGVLKVPVGTTAGPLSAEPLLLKGTAFLRVAHGASGTVSLGKAGVTTSTGLPVKESDGLVPLPINDLNKVHAIATQNTDVFILYGKP